MSGYLPSLEGFLKGTAATVATLSTVGVGLIYYGQNSLVYPSTFGPGAEEVASPKSFGLDWEDLELKTSDGVLLRCFLLPQRRNLPQPSRSSITVTPINYDDDETDDEFIARRPTVIMFHGNGGNVGHRIPLGMMFQLCLRCNVLMVSYRGYGKSEGSPSEKGLMIDAQTALDYLTTDPRFSQTQIILYGQSIGGAVSIDLASRNPSKIAALILENTFTSLPALVPHVMPFLGPVAFLCHQKWDSASKVHLIPAKTPILMLSGNLDELVPQQHMMDLCVLFKEQGEMIEGKMREGEKRLTWVQLPHGQHNDTSAQRGYWSAVDDFLQLLTKLHVKPLSHRDEKPMEDLGEDILKNLDPDPYT